MSFKKSTFPLDEFPVLKSYIPAVSVGSHVVGIAPYFPDVANPYQALLGVVHRQGKYFETRGSPELTRKFREFCDRKLLPASVAFGGVPLIEFEEWLQSRGNYTVRQKSMLRSLYLSVGCDSLLLNPDEATTRKQARKAHAFIKLEGYLEKKHSRGINGRDDISKVVFGPLIAFVENFIYKFFERYNVKSIPVCDRTKHIRTKYSKYMKIITIDYSSFEASFFGTILEAEKSLFSMLLGTRLATVIFDHFYSNNHCQFKWFSLFALARRCSGDSQTSLGNWITNLFVILFVIEEIYDLTENDVSLDCEGDDSIIGVPPFVVLNDCDFTQFGLIAKILQFPIFSDASFCGMVFSRNGDNIFTNYQKILAKFSLIDGKYVHSKHIKQLRLWRAKGLSMLYNHSGCPIVGSVARYILRMTHGLLPIFGNDWWTWINLPPMDTRWDKYINNRPTSDDYIEYSRIYQIEINLIVYLENVFDNKLEISPIELPALHLIFSRELIENGANLIPLNLYPTHIDISNCPRFDQLLSFFSFLAQNEFCCLNWRTFRYYDPNLEGEVEDNARHWFYTHEPP